MEEYELWCMTSGVKSIRRDGKWSASVECEETGKGRVVLKMNVGDTLELVLFNLYNQYIEKTNAKKDI